MKIKNITAKGIEFDNGSTLTHNYSGEDIRACNDFFVWFNWPAMESFGGILEEEFPKNSEKLIVPLGDSSIALAAKSGRKYLIPLQTYAPAKRYYCIPEILFNGEHVDIERFQEKDTYLLPSWRSDRISEPVTIKSIHENGVEFTNGMRLQTFHQHGCSESHWADWSMLESYNINPRNGNEIEIKDMWFSMLLNEMIQPIEGLGFALVAMDGSKYFIPCYGDNNGYYTADITLVLGAPGRHGEIMDLTNCQKLYDDFSEQKFEYMEYLDQNPFIEKNKNNIYSGKFDYNWKKTRY